MAASCAVLAIALGQAIPPFFSGRLPQVAGANVLTLVLGDARLVLSNAMLDKAEEYFHGGVRDVVCEFGLGGAHDEHDHKGEDHGEGAEGAVRATDLWDRVNSLVHAQAHRHVEGDEARELLPWLWAACRASPQNIQAYESAAFVLESMLKRPAEAALLLEEGIRHNPDSASLEYSLGKLSVHAFHDFARAERAFSTAREKCRPAEGPAGDADRFLEGNILFYLGFLAKQRGDLGRARAYLAEIEALVPNHVAIRDLRDMLQEK